MSAWQGCVLRVGVVFVAMTLFLCVGFGQLGGKLVDPVWCAGLGLACARFEVCSQSVVDSKGLSSGFDVIGCHLPVVWVAQPATRRVRGRRTDVCCCTGFCVVL